MRSMLFRRLSCLGVVVAFFLAASQAQNISTIAGGGPNNLSATSSSIGYPWSVAVDSAGNTYISDNYSSRIFKVDTSTTLTVFAGNTVHGYSGDGSSATSATLNGPKGIAFDGAGNLYIADANNAAIRVVNTNSSGSTTVAGVQIAAGNIATVAGNGTTCLTAGNSPACGDGGPALGPTLSGPSAVFVDASGNIFIADSGDNLIRKVDTSGIITTVAGTGGACSSPTSVCGDAGLATSAQLNSPTSVFVDASGNIFIVDSGDNRIREVASSTKNISTVAGTGTACSSPTAACGDGGAATSAQLNLTQYNSVLKGTYYYGGIFVDGSGNIYIADSSDNRIREVSGGNISTVAGDGNLCVQSTVPECGDTGAATSAQLSLPTGVLIDASGNTLIADQNANAVRVVVAGTIDPSGSPLAGVIDDVSWSGDGPSPLDAELNQSAIYSDGSGDIFIADTFNGAIRELSAGGSLSTIMGGHFFCNVAPCGDGGLASAGSLGSVSDIFVDTSNNVFFADFEPSNGPMPGGLAVIREITSGGTVTKVAGTYGTLGYTGDNGPATSATMGGPPVTVYPSGLASLRKGLGLALDQNGTIYIADALNNAVRVVNPSASPVVVAGVNIPAGDIATIAGDGTPCSSPNAACGDDGPATGAQLNTPMGVAVDSSGNIYIADTLDNRVREVVGSTGIIQTFAGTGTACSGSCSDYGLATAAELNFPVAVRLDGSGNVFIADANDAVVREVSASDGDIRFVAGNYTFGFSGDGGAATSAELAAPYGLAFDPSGNLLISDAAAWRVRKVTPATLTSSATTLTSSLNPSQWGQSVTFTATVTPSTATGSVTFLDGSTVLGTAALSGGVATLPTSTLAVGTHSITANYGGTLAINGSVSSPAVSQVVTAASTATVLTSTPNPSAAGQSVTFTATVTSGSGTPGGDVTFMDGSAVLGTSSPMGGVATLSTSTLTVGTHSITANYTDTSSSDFAASTSSPVTQVVLASTTTTLTSSANPSVAGQSVTLTATVKSSSGTPAGNVTFMDGSTALGTKALSAGVATLATSTLTTTTHTITAVYGGNSTFAESTSTAISQTVQDFKIAITSLSPASVSPGGSATATITLTSVNGYNTAVTVTGSVSPTVSEGPSWKLSSSTLTPSSSGATATLTLTTVGSSAALIPPANERKFFLAIGLFLPAIFISTAGLSSKNRRGMLSCFLAVLALAGCLVFTSCGSSSVTNPPPGNGGTPAGKYTVTITATAGTASHTTTTTLTVQ